MRTDGLGSVVDPRLVNEHDRDVVLDRIDAPADVAFESRPVVDEVNGRLVIGADEDFEECGVHRHAANIINFTRGRQKSP